MVVVTHRPPRLPRLALALLAALAIGTGGCASAASSPGGQLPSTTPSASADSLAAARADLDLLLERLERTHPEPFHGIPRAEWLAQLDDLSQRLPQLSPLEAQVELQRVVALLSRNGRDGHQFALPLGDAEGPVLPIRVYEFDDGVFVTDALEPHRDLIGSRLISVGGHGIDDVLDALEPLIPRDGPSTVPDFRPVMLLRTSVLRGLGLVGEGSVEISVDAAEGVRKATLDPIPFADWRAWGGDLGMIRLPDRPGTPYLDEMERGFRTEFMEDSGTLYVRFTEVQRIGQDAIDAMRERARQPDVERVVVDVRQNPGGNNQTYPPLLTALRDPAIDRPGHLFVLTDHVTFSAAANFVTEIEQSTSAIFAGQAPGGGLNFWDDVEWVFLPHFPVPMQVGVSTRYWQKAEADDPRLTIEPDMPIPSLSTDYFADRDPVLEAVVAR